MPWAGEKTNPKQTDAGAHLNFLNLPHCRIRAWNEIGQKWRDLGASAHIRSFTHSLKKHSVINNSVPGTVLGTERKWRLRRHSAAEEEKKRHLYKVWAGCQEAQRVGKRPKEELSHVGRKKRGRSKQHLRVTLCCLHKLGFSLHMIFSNLIFNDGELTSCSKLSFH